MVMLKHQSITPRDVAPRAASQGEVPIGGAFELVNTKGRTVREENFRGQWMLVFFGFTACPDVCPTTLATVTQTLNLLGDEGLKLAPIFITVDPARDTPKAMKKYLTHFHPRIIGLTGSAAQIEQAASAYKVYYAKAPGGDATNYMMDHSAYLYLISPQGHYVRHFAHDANPQEVADAIRGYLQ